MSDPLASRDELVVFAHEMANFGHNRGTKAEQERLLESRVDARDGFLAAFDDRAHGGEKGNVTMARGSTIAIDPIS